MPGTAPYGATEVLSLGNIRVNGGQIAAVNSNQALDKAAYLGDANGNETLDAYDSFYISRVSVGLDSGFYAYPLTDPLIIGDVSGEATLSGLDASYVLEKSVEEPVARSPPSRRPSRRVLRESTPRWPFRPGWSRARETVDSTVAITDNAASLAGASFFIDYPTNFVGIDATQVALSSYMASQGFTLVAYSPSPGKLNVGMYNSKGTFSNYGAPQLFTMPFDVLLSAPSGTAPITFDPTGGSTLNGGYLTMTPCERQHHHRRAVQLDRRHGGQRSGKRLEHAGQLGRRQRSQRRDDQHGLRQRRARPARWCWTPATARSVQSPSAPARRRRSPRPPRTAARRHSKRP